MRFYLVLLVLCAAIGGANAQLQDFNYWSAFSVDKRLDKKTTAGFTTQVRFTENSSRYNFSFFDFGIDRKINKRFDVRVAYCFNIKRDVSDYWNLRHQIYGDVTYDKKIGNVKFANRFRLQSDLDDELEYYYHPFSAVYYRNKSSLKVELTKKTSMYTSFEWYYKLNNRAMNDLLIHRTRTMIGVSNQLKKRKELDVYFMLQQQMRKNTPEQLYVLGTKYTLMLKKRKK